MTTPSTAGDFSLADKFNGGADVLAGGIDGGMQSSVVGHRGEHSGIKMPLSIPATSERHNDDGDVSPKIGTLRPMASDLTAERRRQAMRKFMVAHALNPTQWARNAKISRNVINNFLNRISNSITSASLEKLARAADVPVGEIMGEERGVTRYAGTVPVSWLAVRVEANGDIFPDADKSKNI